MIGRLVHEQHVGLLQDQLAEQHAPFFAAGDHLHRFLRIVAGKQQAAKRAAHHLVVVALAGPSLRPVEERQVLVEIRRVVLGEIARTRLLRPLHLAAAGRKIARQAAQQGGLADAVGADDGDPLTRLDQQIEIAEERPVVGLGEALHLESDAVQLFLFVHLEADIRVLPARRLDVLDLDFLDLPGAAGGLPGLGFVGRKAAHEILQLGHFLLGLGVVLHQLRPRLGGGKHIIVVVARINLDGVVVEIRHVRAHAVEKMAVVGNDDHGAVEAVQHALQPADGVDVQVVGGFIEQQDVRLGKERLRQQHAQLPAGRDRAHRPGVLFDGNANAQQQFAGARFGRVTVVLADHGFQIGGMQVVFFGGVGVGIDGVALVDRRPQLRVAHHHHIQHALVFKGELVLAQLADTVVGIDGHLAAGLLQIAAENLHEGGLAATVGADEPVAVAFAELDGNVFEQGLGPELHGDIGGDDHGRLSDRLATKGAILPLPHRQPKLAIQPGGTCVT